MKSLFCVIAAVLFLTSGVAFGAPEPTRAPGLNQWTIDVVSEHPEQITVPVNGKARRFWYTIVTLTNNTGRDVKFYPGCELMTDTFEILPAGKGVSQAVFERIKTRHRGRFPLLETWERGGKILQGRDNARDIAIIFSDFGPAAKHVKFFIAGLSNEAVAINHPVAKDKDGKAVKVYLRKTLELSYGISGDPAFRADAKLRFEGQRWVMR